MLETLGWAVLFVVVLLAGFLFRKQTVRLGKEVFGVGYQRLRYLDKYWVIEGAADGRRVRYRTGSMGFRRTWTYLFIDTLVPADVSVVKGDETVNLPPQLNAVVASLRQADGFERLDLVRKGSSSEHAFGRVSWLHPGPGIMLHRFTKHCGDSKFIRDDLIRLLRIADLLSGDQRHAGLADASRRRIGDVLLS